MYERSLQYGRGYTGKMGKKCWIALITGTSKQYGLAREFVKPDKVEREHFNSPRAMIDFTWDLDAGLYELSEGGERWIILVHAKDGQYKAFRPDEARIKAILSLMDEGSSFEDARLATKPAVAV